MVRRHRLRSFEQPIITPELLTAVRSLALPLRSVGDLDPLMKRIGDARYVLLGEASHGTRDYYTWRTAISQRLIEEKGFSFIAVEGDWPDCYRVNRYIKNYPDSGQNAREVLFEYQRWPTWMWANADIVELAEWLRQHNDRLPSERKVGFYGLDVYSLWDSLYHVLGYLRKHAPTAMATARRTFECFEPYGENVQDYARATQWVDASCQGEVIRLLEEVRRARPPFATLDDHETFFNAEQNALALRDAEHYYRTMVLGGPDSWNVRDRHMTEVLDRLIRRHGPSAKAIVWEHNTHIGDARQTDMADDGMVNVGQLVREAHAPEGVVLVGFGSYRGEVIAASAWDAPAERMRVPPAQAGSWEDLLHQIGGPDRLLLFDRKRESQELMEERGHRAIGVVYHPEREQFSNYVPTVLPRRYDAFIYLDETSALQPLHAESGIDIEVPETYPSGV